MKTILALLIIGAAYVTASPTCHKDDYIRCFKYIPGSEDVAFRETEEFLEKKCEQFGCAIDYEKACGLPDNQPSTISSFKRYREIYDAVCGKNILIIRKFVENLPCLNRVAENMGDKCQIKERQGPHDPEYCPSVEDYLDCVRDLVRNGCGKEAVEVIDEILLSKESFGC